MTLNKDGNKQRVQYLGKQGVQTSVEKYGYRVMK